MPIIERTERSVKAGSRLGPYEIVSRIGAGGMGEVWRARDQRLRKREWGQVFGFRFADPTNIGAERMSFVESMIVRLARRSKT